MSHKERAEANQQALIAQVRNDSVEKRNIEILKISGTNPCYN